MLQGVPDGVSRPAGGPVQHSRPPGTPPGRGCLAESALRSPRPFCVSGEWWHMLVHVCMASVIPS